MVGILLLLLLRVLAEQLEVLLVDAVVIACMLGMVLILHWWVTTVRIMSLLDYMLIVPVVCWLGRLLDCYSLVRW